MIRTSVVTWMEAKALTHVSVIRRSTVQELSRPLSCASAASPAEKMSCC